MKALIQSKIDTFEILVKNLATDFSVSKQAELAYTIKPKESLSEEIDLTVMAVTHGNELAGLSVINRVLEQIVDQPKLLNFNLAVVLANTPASFENVRFRKRDLNRSFDFKGECDSFEVKRAKELEPLLRKTKLLIDIHQTIEASKSGFFIFPFSKGSFELAHSLCEELPIVTHWGGGFSKDGKCTDEFVNENGGIGLTVELGHKGFDLYQESLGFNIVMKGFAVVTSGLVDIKNIDRENIYSWSHIEKYPEGDVELKDGLVNFQEINKDELYIHKIQSLERLLFLGYCYFRNIFLKEASVLRSFIV